MSAGNPFTRLYMLNNHEQKRLITSLLPIPKKKGFAPVEFLSVISTKNTMLSGIKYRGRIFSADDEDRKKR